MEPGTRDDLPAPALSRRGRTLQFRRDSASDPVDPAAPPRPSPKSTVSRSRFFSAPAKAPRTVCGCQPVAATISSTVAPSARPSMPTSSACLVPSRVLPDRPRGGLWGVPGRGAALGPRRRRACPRGRHRGAVGLDAEGVETGRRDPQQDAAAVVGVAPETVQRGVGLGDALHGPLLGQPADEQRGDHPGRGAAPDRAGQRQQVAVGDAARRRSAGSTGYRKASASGPPGSSRHRDIPPATTLSRASLRSAAGRRPRAVVRRQTRRRSRSRRRGRSDTASPPGCRSRGWSCGRSASPSSG